MKRYRTLHNDYDYRANLLKLVVTDEWDPRARSLHNGNTSRIVDQLRAEYGAHQFDQKLKNFVDLGARPSSILAFHNKFLYQIRDAFVTMAYYPALTSACALGERILNHIILAVRAHFSSSPLYKKVYRKDSFDNWRQTIDTLTQWGVFRQSVTDDFLLLEAQRNAAIHFNVETYREDRPRALESVLLIGRIIEQQFGTFGDAPWFLQFDGGVAFIKKEWESSPFIREFYIPACAYVGPAHRVRSMDGGRWTFDDSPYEDREITDEEFTQLYRTATAHPPGQ